ncbi:hypothetical protein LINGRAHAP2_LOCUS9960 [Linum grandiflorum]
MTSALSKRNYFIFSRLPRYALSSTSPYILSQNFILLSFFFSSQNFDYTMKLKCFALFLSGFNLIFIVVMSIITIRGRMMIALWR